MKKVAYIGVALALMVGIVYMATTLNARRTEATVSEIGNTTSASDADASSEASASKKSKKKKKKSNKKKASDANANHTQIGAADSPMGPVVSTAKNPLLYVKVPASVKNQRINHTAYVTYFNAQHGIPNCVIYDLSATEVAQCDAPGAEKRNDYKFYADPLCADALNGTTTGLSYDRGHMAPAADMKWSRLLWRSAST